MGKIQEKQQKSGRIGPKPIVYSVGWHTFEGHDDLPLVHDRDFSRDEFESLVNAALVEVFERALEGDEPVLMDEAIRRAARVLREKHGFSTPRIVGVSYEWPLEKGIERAVDPKLRKAIPPGLLENVLEHNERNCQLKLQKTRGRKNPKKMAGTIA
jgi:hypothetical protein